MENKLDKLKKILEVSSRDTISAKEIEKFLVLVLNTIKTERESFKNLSDEQLSTISEKVSFIDSIKDNFKVLFVDEINEAKKLLNEISKIKSTPGKDGNDYVLTNSDKEEIASLIEVPIVEKTEIIKEIPQDILGETIVDKINELPTDDNDLKIDYKHIKNAPDVKQFVGGGRSNLSQLNDVRLGTLSNNDVLKYNSTTNIWENGVGGGGSQTLEQTLILGNTSEGNDLLLNNSSRLGLFDNPNAEYAYFSFADSYLDIHLPTTYHNYFDFNLITANTTHTFPNASGTIALGSGSANELSYWSGTNTLSSLSTATYPSLTELSYVKGVTSAIQTQLNGKAPSLGADDNYVTDAQLIVIGNTSGTNTGDQDLSSYLTSATAASTYQPLDTQLTSLAGLSYTGNSLKVVRVNAGETDFELATISAGSGDVSKVGTPVNNQLGIWTGDGTIEGDSNVTYDSATGYLHAPIMSVNSIFDIGTHIAGVNISGNVAASGFNAYFNTNSATVPVALLLGTTNTYAKSVRFQAYPASYSTSGMEIADNGALFTVGMNFNVGTYSNHNMDFWTNNTRRGGISNAGAVDFTGALTVGGTGTFSDQITLNKNQNGATSIRINNLTTGTAAQADFRAYNDAGYFFALGIYSSGTSTYGALTANSALNYGSGTGGIVLMADNASGTIRFAAGGNTERWRINSTGLIAGADNTYDIGASGATRPRAVYVGTTVVSPLFNGGTTGIVNTGTIELGHASANTLSASGGILSIEGVAIPTVSNTVTLTNKTLTAPLLTLLVEANTAGVASPNIITSAESYTTYTNEGATALNYHTLPTAVAGLTFTWVVQDVDGIRIVANTGDTIRVAGVVSGAAGYTTSVAIGDSITLTAINATEWVATSVVGSWLTI